MPSKVYNNVEDFRMLNEGVVCEDVTSVTLPTIEHPTSTFNASGMAVDVDMPNMTHLNAMEFSVSHNNGVNCRYLETPGRHSMEFRVVRQRYNVAAAEVEHESVKYRIIGAYKSTDKGNVETNNPLGSTAKYSILRYEEEIDGEVVILIDAMAGIIRINGVDYTNFVQSLLE